MTVQITQVRMSPADANTHQHITDYKWANRETGATGQSTKAAMVEWIDVKHGRAFVETATTSAPVGVVKPTGGEPYLRTYADGAWTDNLLALPRF